ncbi:hypothetical protein ACYOEI_15400 [Singulisphaera rosea]
MVASSPRLALESYQRLPEWAQPIVWGVGITLPLLVVIFLYRLLAR